MISFEDDSFVSFHVVSSSALSQCRPFKSPTPSIRLFRNLVLPEQGKVLFLVFLLFLNASKNFEKSFERRASGFLRCCCSPFSFDSILFFRFSIWIVLMSDNIWREREIWEMERGGEIDVKKELCGWSDFFPVRTMERRREASRDLQLVGRESIG